MKETTRTFRLLHGGAHRPLRMLFITSLLIVYLAVTTNTASAATYYLDAVNGDDTNPGSSEQPWKTISKAQSSVQPGDIVTLSTGNYGAFVDTTVRADWITWKADTGHTPVFSELWLGQGGAEPIPVRDSYLHFEGITVTPGHDDGTAEIVRLLYVSHVKLINMTIIGNGFDRNKLNTSDSAISVLRSNDVVIDSCIVTGTGEKGVNQIGEPDPSYGACSTGIFSEYSNNVIVRNCTIEKCHRGIVHWGWDWEISHNTLDYITGDGILMINSATTNIDENYIRVVRPQWDGGHADCIQPYTHSGRFADPDGDGTNYGPGDPRPGFDIAFGNINIRRNKMYVTESGPIDGPSGEAYNHLHCLLWNNFKEDLAPRNIKIESNLMVHPGGSSYCIDLTHLDDHEAVTEGLEFINNTVIGAIRLDSDIKDAEIVNNIVTGSFNFDIVGGGTCTSENNNIVFAWYNWGSFVHGDKSLELYDQQAIKDLFVNSTDGNYHLASDSQAIDFCPLDKAPATDLDGNSRIDIEGLGNDGSNYADAGCYEYAAQGNNAPVLAAIGNKSVNENSVLTFIVSAADADGDTITYSAQNLPSRASFTGQTFSWTPSYDQAGSHQVTFIASDGTDQDSETITITVSNTNRAPELQTIGDKSVNENSALSFSTSATDADGDTITYSAENLPSGAVFGSQTFSWTPSYSQAGTYQVTFNASDSQLQDSETITITANNVNRAPVLSAIGNKSVYATNSLSFTVSAADADGDTMEYSANGLPSGASFTNRTFSWTPSQNQAGSYQVTFAVSDGQSEDSETITITVYDVDTTAPTVTGCSPEADAIQVPLNTLVILHITDSGEGVDADSPTIKVNDNLVYSGDTAHYSSAYGDCRRTGTKADYTFTYQPDEMFEFDRTVNVTVNATDIASNTMSEYSYSFNTEMRSFGKNKKAHPNSNNGNKGKSATARDNNGNIWVTWDEGQTDQRDIYVGEMAAGEDSFSSSTNLTNNTADQYNSAIAVDNDDKLYLVWQDNRRGDWDIYISTSTDGVNYSTPRRVADSNDNQINPAIVVDSSYNAYVVWEDDRNSNQDIYVASSDDDFVTKTVSRITSNTAEQTEPAITAGSDGTIYIVWTDARGGSNNIYGASSDGGPWTNKAIVSNSNNQSATSVAVESAGSILHLLWVDDTSGNYDIYYGSSNGIPTSPLTGSSIIDDSSGANQSAPVIAVTGSTGASLKAFACWQDERNVTSGNGDTDIYFADLASSDKTNVLVGDDNTNSSQADPLIAINGHNHPYLVWTDNRNVNTEIYYAGSTYIEPSALQSGNVSAASGATVGTDPQNISSADDVSVTVPAGASQCDTTVIISKVKNPQALAVQRFSSSYEFGPSGVEYTEPVTITIPYEVPGSGNSTSAYWYNPLTGTLSQEGITDIETIVISPTLHALRFKTTHFTQFFIGGGVSTSSGGGGGGGCSMSHNSQAGITEFLLPYVVLAVVMTILKLRDARNRKLETS